MDAPNHATSQGGSTSKHVYCDYWEAPERFWKPRVRELEDTEIHAILVNISFIFRKTNQLMNILERGGVVTIEAP
jgi:hypothetical protein